VKRDAVLMQRVRCYLAAWAAREKAQVMLEGLHDFLVKGIPAGSAVGGLYHQTSVKLIPDQARLRKLGRWEEITREAVDADKLKALVRIMPALLKTRAVKQQKTSRLVVLDRKGSGA